MRVFVANMGRYWMTSRATYGPSLMRSARAMFPAAEPAP
jgi:hypothetical protein